MRDITFIHEYNIKSDTREIFFIRNDEIDSETLDNFIKNVKILESNKSPIILHLSSIGGDRVLASGIYDTIRHSPCPFIIVCYGVVASAASIILQAATEKGYRILTKNCSLVIHEGFIALENNPKSAISQIAENNRLVDDMYNIYAEACQTGEYFKDDKVHKIKGYIKRKLASKEDWYITAKEAVYYGFADGILGDEGYATIQEIKGYL